MQSTKCSLHLLPEVTGEEKLRSLPWVLLLLPAERAHCMEAAPVAKQGRPALSCSAVGGRLRAAVTLLLLLLLLLLPPPPPPRSALEPSPEHAPAPPAHAPHSHPRSLRLRRLPHCHQPSPSVFPRPCFPQSLCLCGCPHPHQSCTELVAASQCRRCVCLPASAVLSNLVPGCAGRCFRKITCQHFKRKQQQYQE